MKKIAIILAGGEGHRAGGDTPKQFQEVAGHPMYQWSLLAFHRADPSTEILLVCHPGAFDLLDILEDEREKLPEENPFHTPIPFKLICGGRSRRESVTNALMEIEADPNILVAVHDSARPLVSSEMIMRGWEKVTENGTAVPTIPMTDSLRELTDDDSTIPVDRAFYLLVQTPQIFRADIIKRAYDGNDSPALTDDASIVQSNGQDIATYVGEHTNFKVTVPSDFIVASALLTESHK